MGFRRWWYLALDLEFGTMNCWLNLKKTQHNEIDLNLKSKNKIIYGNKRLQHIQCISLHCTRASSFILLNKCKFSIHSNNVYFVSFKEFVTRLLVFADYRESIGNPKTDRGLISTNTWVQIRTNYYWFKRMWCHQNDLPECFKGIYSRLSFKNIFRRRFR